MIPVNDAMLEDHQNPKEKLRISALQNFSNIILSPILYKFLEKNNDVDIEINLEGALGPLPAIGDYDIAFRSGRLEDASAISRLVFSHDYIVCASNSYLERWGVPKTLDDLAKHNCLDCSHGIKPEKHAWTFFDGNVVHTIPIKTNIYTNNALFVKHLALNDTALIYAPAFIVAEEINQGSLIPLLTNYKTITNPIYLIHPYTNGNLPKRIKCFIDFLFDNLTVPSINKL